MIDLRSDTVTKPTPAMRSAMAAAEVGDDVYGEDPTVNRLQEMAAEIFEKEAALLVASGTMGNQIAVKTHTKPGDEVVIEERTHIYNFEVGMAGIMSGVTFRTIRSRDASGQITWDEIAAAYRKGDDHASPTALVCLENTHNYGGGSVMPADRCAEICENAHRLGLRVHLDGARIFNAAVASRSCVADLTKGCDSVQFCLSKGLGAPIGSLLVGDRPFIDEARMWRKRMGGGMRQAGIIAAAGIVALKESPGRLHEDHTNARRLADGLAAVAGIDLDPESVATNIVILSVKKTGMSPDAMCDKLRAQGVLASSFDSSIRMVTHRGVSSHEIEVAIAAVKQVLESKH